MNKLESILLEYLDNDINYHNFKLVLNDLLKKGHLLDLFECLYLYSFYNDDESSIFLRSIIENFIHNDKQDISLDNILFAKLIVNNLLTYLKLIKNNPFIKKCLIEVAFYKGNKTTLEKLKLVKVNSKNELCRNILIEYYLELFDMGLQIHEIFDLFDDYFKYGHISPSIRQNYNSIINANTIKEQIRILYQILFLYLKNNETECEELESFLYESINQDNYSLPENDFIRHQLYYYFFMYILTNNLSLDIAKLKKNDYVLIKKINPYIDLDLL